MKNLITIQHAQSVHHTNGMVGSWTDWDLTELGREQARRIGVNLAAELGETPYVMYASDLLRARHTAEIAGEALGLSPILTPVLRERNFGAAVGQSVQWMRENMTAPEKTVDDRLFPDAESRREVWQRLLPFCRELLDGGDENIILVSHGDTLSIFHALWLGMEPEMLNRCDFCGKAAGVSLLREDDDGRRLIYCFCDMSYSK